jgi:dihydrofolate synthase/folylpolyglutamate synthase
LGFKPGEQSLRIYPANGIGPVDLEISLDGAHQVENAAVAYAALSTAAQQGLEKLEDQTIAEGFKQVKWPGRFEILQEKPTVVLDCAHNRDSAAKLRCTLDDYFPDER